MAASTGLFTTNALAGINLYDASSTAKFGKLTTANDTAGRKRVYGLLAKAMGSIQTVQIGTAGSVTTLGSTTATYIMNHPGGVATGTYVWIQQRTT